MTNFIIYLLVDTEVIDGRRKMYVGLTTDGTGRFATHYSKASRVVSSKGILTSEKADRANCDFWFHGIISRGDIPYHLVLETASTLKQLQLLEIIFIKVLRLMGENLVNISDGGQAGESTLQNRGSPYSDATLRDLRDDIKKLLPEPTVEKPIYDLIREFENRVGGFHADSVRRRILFAKNSLLSHPEVRLRLVKDPETAPVIEASTPSPKQEQTPKTKKVCSKEGCEKDHHGNGLCRKHDDLRRRLAKKGAERPTG